MNKEQSMLVIFGIVALPFTIFAFVHIYNEQSAPVTITNIVVHQETTQPLVINWAKDNSTQEDIVLPTGVPDVATKVATTVNFNNNQQQDVDISLHNIDKLIGRTLLQRNSEVTHVTVTAKTKKGQTITANFRGIDKKVGNTMTQGEFDGAAQDYQQHSSNFRPETLQETLERYITNPAG